jgi:hypothetical protein
MPIERRQILLSEAELLHAIEVFRHVRPDFLPHGDVSDCKMEPAGADGTAHITISVSMIYGETRQAIKITTKEADILELLIRCCLENNIPIPRAGSKSTGIVDGRLALMICSDSEFST